MTIVPTSWQPRAHQSRPAAAVRLISFTVLALVCASAGIVVLSQGEALGLGALLFSTGYVVRAALELRTMRRPPSSGR